MIFEQKFSNGLDFLQLLRSSKDRCISMNLLKELCDTSNVGRKGIFVDWGHEEAYQVCSGKSASGAGVKSLNLVATYY